MIKSFIVDSTFDGMRLDRLLRNKLGKIPQSLIEKSLRAGKIKINKRKIKSSFKVKTNDKIDLFNFDFKEETEQKKIKFNPSNEVIKANEDLIIDNNVNCATRAITAQRRKGKCFSNNALTGKCRITVQQNA